jgi:hypothetical protein
VIAFRDLMVNQVYILLVLKTRAQQTFSGKAQIVFFFFLFAVLGIEHRASSTVPLTPLHQPSISGFVGHIAPVSTGQLCQ